MESIIVFILGAVAGGTTVWFLQSSISKDIATVKTAVAGLEARLTAITGAVVASGKTPPPA